MYNDCPVSFEFSNPMYLEYFVHLMENGRVDSIKEAINLFIFDMHKRKLLLIQQQIAMNAEFASKAASDAANAAADAASSRWNNIMNFWRD